MTKKSFWEAKGDSEKLYVLLMIKKNAIREPTFTKTRESPYMYNFLLPNWLVWK